MKQRTWLSRSSGEENTSSERVGPCEESGEFHTLVYGTSVSYNLIAVRISNLVKKDGFVFTDLKLN